MFRLDNFPGVFTFDNFLWYVHIYSLSESPLEMASKVSVSWGGGWSFNEIKNKNGAFLKIIGNLGTQLKDFQTGGVGQTAQLRDATNDKCFSNLSELSVADIRQMGCIRILTSLLGNVERTLYSSGRYLRETQIVTIKNSNRLATLLTTIESLFAMLLLNAHPLLLRKRRRMLRGSEARNLRANVSEGVRNLEWQVIRTRLKVPLSPDICNSCAGSLTWYLQGEHQSLLQALEGESALPRAPFEMFHHSQQCSPLWILCLPIWLCPPLTCRAFSLSSASRASCSLLRFASSTCAE